MTTVDPQHPTFGEALGRALRLRCPRCGRERLFIGWFRMSAQCTQCKLRYERAPGYFLGSAYINYGVTSVAEIVAYFTLHIRAGFTNRELLGPMVGFFVLFPCFFFRYARALWLALDFQLDPSSFESSGEEYDEP